MSLPKTFSRLLLKTLLTPISLLLLLIKGTIRLAMKLIELPLGLFLWLMLFTMIYCVVMHQWANLLFIVLTLAAIVLVMFVATVAELLIDNLRQMIRSI